MTRLTVAELRSRRAARGDADPLNRLRRITAENIDAGQTPITEQRPEPRL